MSKFVEEVSLARLEELDAFKNKFPGVEVQEYCARRREAIESKPCICHPDASFKENNCPVHGEPGPCKTLLKRAKGWKESDLQRFPTATLELIDRLAAYLEMADRATPTSGKEEE